MSNGLLVGATATDTEPYEDDDVPEDYPVPTPMEVPEEEDDEVNENTVDTANAMEEQAEKVGEDVQVKEVPGWCGIVDYALVGPGNTLTFDDRAQLGSFLDLVKHPGFDQFVENVRAGNYDKYVG